MDATDPRLSTIGISPANRSDPGLATVRGVLIASIRKLASGELAVRGAMPCMGLLQLSDLVAQMSGLAIETMRE